MKAIAIPIIFLILVSAAFAQAPQLPTPQISGCDALMELDAPETIYLDAEVAIVVPVNVTNVRCTASHVYVDIEGIRPDIMFTLSPDFYQSVLPNQTVSFNLTMPPSKSLNKSEYTGIYWIRTNNKWFNKGNVKITSEEKPAEKKDEIIEKKIPVQNKTEIPETADEKTTNGRPLGKNPAVIFVLALLIGIFSGAYYYFKQKDTGKKSHKAHAEAEKSSP